MGKLNENQLESCRKWYWKNKEYKNQKCKEWYNGHKEERKEYNKQWREQNKEYDKQRRLNYKHTPMGRASHLVQGYKTEDEKHNRGECTLTKEWIVEKIFSKPCTHCGKSGWEIIGCNRLDNSKPHTPDNVEPCCEECNKRLNFKEMSKQVFQYTLEGKLIGVWESTQEIERKLGFCHSKISACCLGKRKTHKGFRWGYATV